MSSGSFNNNNNKIKVTTNVFVPKGIKVVKGNPYIGEETHFPDIKVRLLAENWGPNVKTIYVTNGWHKGFEPNNSKADHEGWVTYCDYTVNADNGIGKYHYYK